MGALDTMIGNAFGDVFGTGTLLAAAIIIFFAYVAFKSGVPMSGLVFIGVLLAGMLVVMGILDLVWFALLLIIGAYMFWRTAMQVAG
jgi:hypothetical protein